MPPRKKAVKSTGTPAPVAVAKPPTVKTFHTPLWATLFLFAEVAEGFPYNNARFQELSGLSELGFLDPELVVNGKPVSKEVHQQLKMVHQTLKDDPIDILRSTPVSAIQGLKTFNNVARALLGKKLRSHLVKTLIDRKATFGDIYTYNLDHTQQMTPAHKVAVAGAGWYTDIFGEEGVDPELMSEPAWTNAVSELYYRLYDAGGRGHRTLLKNINKHIEAMQQAIAGESYLRISRPSTSRLTRIKLTRKMLHPATSTKPPRFAIGLKICIANPAFPSTPDSSPSLRNSPSTSKRRVTSWVSPSPTHRLWTKLPQKVSVNSAAAQPAWKTGRWLGRRPKHRVSRHPSGRRFSVR